MIRLATFHDNEDLLALTASNPMQGAISLRIDRKPDFFRMLQVRGESITFLLEKDEKLVGSFSASKSRVYIQGQPTTLYYLSDLKVDASYRAGVYAFRLVARMYEYLQSKDADLLFCTAAHGNSLVQPLFNGRAAIPKFTSLGQFQVFQVLPSGKSVSGTHLAIRNESLEQPLSTLFNQFYKGYQLGKIVGANKDTNVLVAYENSEPVAALTLLDTLPMKQNVVVGLQPHLRAVVALSNTLSTYLPLYRLPEIGQVVRNLYVNNFYYKPSQEKALLTLIQVARNIAFRDQYHFLSIGLHEKDPLLKHFRGLPKFEFKSHGYITSLKKNTQLVQAVRNGIPFEDYSLV
jgi:ribosomal protein S18 acetylase RimI-like enzyme